MNRDPTQKKGRMNVWKFWAINKEIKIKQEKLGLNNQDRKRMQLRTTNDYLFTLSYLFYSFTLGSEKPSIVQQLSDYSTCEQTALMQKTWIIEIYS